MPISQVSVLKSHKMRQDQDRIGIPTSFMAEYREIVHYENWRQSVGAKLSQFATIRQLERPMAEELMRRACSAGLYARWYASRNPISEESFLTFVDIGRDSLSTLQLLILVTRAKMRGPKSVNMAKRDRLIDFNDTARNLPTLVITLNPRTEEKVAFIECGKKHRKVSWMTSWNNG
ncbi:hypothetical protein GQ53DRAFT_850155 [Thozetella sp. PMI_491]|nr:hypothetical protein GQ53DRAFT_850155 [Thozetella sp. PMI_491]